MYGIEEALGSLRPIFNVQSVLMLIVILFVAFVIGKILGGVLRAASRFVRKRADTSTNLITGNWLRRAETWIILSIAIMQVLLVIGAFYVWWGGQHPGPGSSSGALIGVSAFAAILIGGITGPLLRDLVFGASMMAEHWYGVGDLITIDPKSKRRG